MALSHVSLKGNPAAAWKYFTRAFTLGRSYALNACRVDLFAVSGMLGRFSFSGFKAIRHSFGPDVSRHPEKNWLFLGVVDYNCLFGEHYLAIGITDLSYTKKGMLERWHYMTCRWKVGRKGGEIKLCCPCGPLYLPCSCAYIDFGGG